VTNKSWRVSACAYPADTRMPEIRMRPESRDRYRFSKTLKISEPIASITASVEDVGTEGLERLEILRLSAFGVSRFLILKSVRYVFAKRGQTSVSVAAKKLRAAMRPRANFAFRETYKIKEDENTYPLWIRIHEDPNAGRLAAIALNEKLDGQTLRIALVVAEGFDHQTIMAQVNSTLVGSKVEIIPISTDFLTKKSVQDLSGDAEWDFILPYDRSGSFAKGAIERLILALIEDSSLAAIFADSDTQQADGSRIGPRLKPPWDQELLWCADYIRAPLLVRWRTELLDTFKLPGAAHKPGYALALGLIALHKREQLSHMPAILFHESPILEESSKIFDRQILEAHLMSGAYPPELTITGKDILRIEWPTPDPSRVSIIIPSRDSSGMLKNCIDSILRKTTRISPEIIIADNGSVQQETLDFLTQIAARDLVKVIRCPGPFNFSKINNDARRHASGDVIVLLNDDTQIISPDWLVEMTGLALRADVGAVGGLLLYPDGTVQHAGIILGIGGTAADHAFRHMPGDSAGYLDLLRCRREISAVTGACLAVSAKHFDTVGGLDEELQVTLNDVDFCLRLRARGLTNIWTPHAVVEHWESKSRGIDFTNAALDRQAKEVQLFYSRWGRLVAHDPNYHTGLSDMTPDYRLAV
jgi:GT2 family glycosyltransferase